MSSRRQYGVLDFMGNLGGFIKMTTTIGTFFLSAYTQHSFILNYISQHYVAKTRHVTLFKHTKRNQTSISNHASISIDTKQNIEIDFDNYKVQKLWCMKKSPCCLKQSSKKTKKLWKVYKEG